jgi:hypothetical protein
MFSQSNALKDSIKIIADWSLILGPFTLAKCIVKPLAKLHAIAIMTVFALATLCDVTQAETILFVLNHSMWQR